MPVTEFNLVLEPRYKHKALEEFRWKECSDQDGTRHVFDDKPVTVESGFTSPDDCDV